MLATIRAASVANHGEALFIEGGPGGRFGVGGMVPSRLWVVLLAVDLDSLRVDVA